MKSKIYLLFFFSTVLFSCKKESVDPNEGELITTVKLEFTDLGNGTKKSFKYAYPF